MITELERRLTEAFHADAERARLVNPDRHSEVRALPLSDTGGATRRRWLLAAAAVTMLIVVSGLAQIGSRGVDAPVPLAPASSVPAPETTTPSNTTVPPETTTPSVTVPAGPSKLFSVIEPETMVTLPPAPIDGRVEVAVWSGTEVITWRGEDSADEGAAFDFETGTWRKIAPAPIDYRNGPAVAWTGAEMILWGGNEPPRSYADGAAYDPATDTWRLLSEAPLGAGFEPPVAVWTGEEVVILGGPGGGAAAYDPATDRWRRLADLPANATPAQAIWTGTSIVATLLVESSEDLGNTPILGRYGPSTDTWDIVDDANYAAVVGIRGADGLVNTIIALPDATGTPVELLDSEGVPVRSLPGVPVDTDKFGDRIDANGLWTGGEALFWIGGDFIVALSARARRGVGTRPHKRHLATASERRRDGARRRCVAGRRRPLARMGPRRGRCRRLPRTDPTPMSTRSRRDRRTPRAAGTAKLVLASPRQTRAIIAGKNAPIRA